MKLSKSGSSSFSTLSNLTSELINRFYQRECYTQYTILFLTSINRDDLSVIKLCVPPQAECISTNDNISLVSNSVYPSNLVHDTVRCRLHCTRDGCYSNKDITLQIAMTMTNHIHQ